MATSVPLLEAVGLIRTFDGLSVLCGASLKVAEGQCVGLIGENGCGKTSLLNVLSGVDQPGSGQVLLGESTGQLTNITRWPAHRRARAGLLHYFQYPHVWRNLTVEEHVLASATDKSLEGSILGSARWILSSNLRNRTNVKCYELLDFVGLRNRAKDRADELSFGQMKLLGLARVLAAPTRRMLLLDEPTAGIAPELVDRVIDLLRKVLASGIGMLIVEHDQEMLSTLADTVLKLSHGKVIRAEKEA